uniref:Uncharacterized protein n=1 Tax=Escherichia coli TaxID=562 RepID=A0A2Z2CL03_ECOLX|nr:hypothetical protein [Escherichia coli]
MPANFPGHICWPVFFASKVSSRVRAGSAKMTAKEGYHGALHNQNE